MPSGTRKWRRGGHLIGDGDRVLEVGGGTGYQAHALSKRGVSVVSVDVAGSFYRNDRVHRIVEYDGRTLPFPDGVFDKVVTSHCLEHVVSLSPSSGRNGPSSARRRVRRSRPPDPPVVVADLASALSAHRPQSSWRTCSDRSKAERRRRAGCRSASRSPGGRDVPVAPALAAVRAMDAAGKPPRGRRVPVAAAVALGDLPRRHGERGNVFTELLYFRPAWWRSHFQQHGWTISAEFPIPIASACSERLLVYRRGGRFRP